MEQRFNERREVLKMTCKKYASKLSNTAIETLNSLYYSKDFNLLLCSVAKAGSSTMKNQLFRLQKGYYKDGNIHKLVHFLRANLRVGGIKEVKELMYRRKKNTTIMTARHPLDRLVSAYRDKYRDGQSRPKGKFINLAKNAVKRDTGGRNSRNITVTFTQFLQLVLNDQRGNVNNHWEPYYKVCTPCVLPYQYIFNTETLNEDFSYISQKIGANLEVDQSFHAHKTSGTTSNTTTTHYFHYYTFVDPDLLRKIYKVYQIDFEMFGYEVPEFLKRVL
ncbi:hypothetical protein Pmani_020681 [Petrolisthes manimaculis]|uniref:Carbohydrate sulfotransferase n=1 Tax=Petrolisthes manimaculis TaxID=1843537 RepID=A0AAE1U6A1_9EUCA|nr:hypothetical protein Pmani_020681 [Petrolisthes manimaculis]